MDEQTRQFVQLRAKGRCEYYHLPQAGHDERFSVDHVRPRKHGGDDTVANLAFSCLRCNLFKGPNLAGIDPDGNRMVPLFDPRRQAWQDHFRWNGPVIIGLTPEGRASVSVMRMNATERVQLRHALIVERILSLD